LVVVAVFVGVDSSASVCVTLATDADSGVEIGVRPDLGGATGATTTGVVFVSIGVGPARETAGEVALLPPIGTRIPLIIICDSTDGTAVIGSVCGIGSSITRGAALNDEATTR
jgi:hypothetical protein